MMAAFTALNTVNKVVDPEERTKELQLEEAVKTYQKALQLHQEKKWAEAERGYINLLSADIVSERGERSSRKAGGLIADSPQSRLQRLVLKNYAQFIMDVLPTRKPQVVEQMLPVALKYFAEALCYSSEDVVTWLQIVSAAEKMGCQRLARFGLESILYETLKGREAINDVDLDDDLPVLPPVTYKAVGKLNKLIPAIHDEYSYGSQLSRRIAKSIGMKEQPTVFEVKSDAKEPIQCEQLRVEADTWFSLGKCLLNAFIKLGPEYLVCTALNIVPIKRERQTSGVSNTGQLVAQGSADEVEDVTPNMEAKSTKRRRSTAEVEEGDSKRRLSKRVRALEENASETGNTRTQEFIESINAIMAPLDFEFGDYSTMEFLRSNTETSDRALDVWKNFLWEWTTERALPFETTFRHKSTSHVADTLLFERAALPTTNRTDPDRVPNGSFEKFSNDIVEEGVHLGQCAVRWLEALTISSDATYTNTPWAKEFLDLVTSVTIMYEDSVLDRVKALFTADSFSAAEPVALPEVEFAQCIFELFVNELFHKAYDRSTVLSAPSLTAEKAAVANEKLSRARDRASRWKFMLGDLLQCSNSSDPAFTRLSLRYRWACAVMAVCDASSDEILFDLFTQLRDDMTALSNSAEIRIRLPNCPAVYEISAAAASREISKLQTIDYFRNMLQSSSTNDPETIQQLKKVLEPDGEATGTLAVVQEFISESSLDFRLSLLHRLEELLYRSGSPVDALSTALCRSLGMVGENINTYDETEQTSPRQREETFLKTLKTAQSLVARSLSMLDELGDNQLDYLSPTDLRPSLTATTTLLRILTIFSLYEDAVEDGKVPIPVEPKYKDFCDVMRDMLTETWRLFYLIFRRVQGITSIKLPAANPASEDSREIVTRCCELLSLVHEELGVHKWCGYGNGKLLALMMDQFLKYNTGEWDHEILQCMFCLFGISVSNENGYPFAHGTNVRVLDGNMAVRIAQFLVHLYSDKRPGFTALKSDYKAALDTVCKSIDHPSLSSKQALAFEVNAGATDGYLREFIDPLKFLTCVKGNLILTSVPLNSDGLDIEDLYHMQGHIHLNQFRARIKSNRSGGEDDLTLAIEHFRKDLLFHPDRWDTWYALAQTYTLESENALAWAADRIEKDRKTIARYQRKSILCFMMAVSSFVRGDFTLKEARPRKLAAPMYFDFGWQIYNSCRPPMEMAAFANDTYKISSGDQGLYVRHRSKLTMSQVLGFAAQCFNSSFTWGHQDWRCSYMLGKCCSKLRHSPTLVLNWYKNAVESAPERSNQGSGELVLDPHYKIIAAALKYVLGNKLSVEDAMPYILSTSYCPRVTDISYVDRNSFLDLALTTFRNIKSADKKHWHHRPIYRIAHLLEVARWDPVGAKLEMDIIVGGATKVKALVSIWRPEFERSGRHFVYAYKYVMYYIHLLDILKDRETLRLIAPKIRKASTSIVNHSKVWEFLCTTYLRLLREHWAILPNLDSYTQDEFNIISERIEVHYMPVEHVPLEVKILRDVASLRKLNNNLISVSWMDDFLVDCYMKIYKLVRNDGRRPETAISVNSTSREPSINGDGEESSSRRPNRVSRKEILQKVFALCKPAPTLPKMGRGGKATEERIVLDDEVMSVRSGSPSRVPSPDVMEIDPPGNM